MNDNYDQLEDLVTNGTLKWETDSIKAVLYRNATFNAAHKKATDIQGERVAISPIQGRSVGPNGEAFGLPVSFRYVPKQTQFQMVLMQEIQPQDFNLLAWIDTDEGGAALTVVRGGTLIIRPVTEVEGEDRPVNIGMWLQL